jgi:DNA polymerase III epsilon subunit-like protein
MGTEVREQINKLAIVDLETTGLNFELNEIVEISVYVLDNLKIKFFFKSLIKPYRWDNINPEAMKVNGIKIEDLEKAPNAIEVKRDLVSWWENDINEKLCPVGYNFSGFDKNFLTHWLGEDYNKMFHYRALNIDSIVRYLVEFTDVLPELKNKSLKLQNISGSLGITHLKHRADGDCLCLIDLIKLINKRIN